ncbi:microtubule-associated tyrosine carboxypeptidase-like [Spea bombifrons]|uniref:microtubule-associated tyrosine carboxypeptidase-like n=1 Tax=Spea bombifrons TaxID=233779 RepID=UPI00234BA0CA|nr:microtubule-associated tyrosine carboxypeptidase-like [Spea bombifrons]
MPAGCFREDQVFLDGILCILWHGRTIHFHLLAALGKVSYEDVEGLRKFAALENVEIPFFRQDLLRHIMETNRPSDEGLQQVIPA